MIKIDEAGTPVTDTLRVSMCDYGFWVQTDYHGEVPRYQRFAFSTLEELIEFVRDHFVEHARKQAERQAEGAGDED